MNHPHWRMILAAGLTPHAIHENHWRVSNGSRKVDFWPSSGSCYEQHPPKVCKPISGKRVGIKFLIDALTSDPNAKALVPVEIPTRVVEQSAKGTVIEVCDLDQADRLDVVYCESRRVR